jgi:hypothetical protein
VIPLLAVLGFFVWRSPAVDWLPEGTEPAEGAAIVSDATGKRYYDQVVKVRDGQRILFRLIPKKATMDPATFYMMENKVWNDLFRTAAQDSGFLRLLDHHKGPPNGWRVAKAWQLPPTGAGKDATAGQRPVMGLTPIEAYSFAVWLKGNLPTRQQWDKAAGSHEENPSLGPYRQPQDGAKPHIAIEGPESWPVGTAHDDVSAFGCRDMAGNGLEWTRDLWTGNHRLPSRDPGKPDQVIYLRGREHDAGVPLVYKDLLDKEESWTEGMQEDLAKISFRVVLEQL